MLPFSTRSANPKEAAMYYKVCPVQPCTVVSQKRHKSWKKISFLVKFTVITEESGCSRMGVGLESQLPGTYNQSLNISPPPGGKPQTSADLHYNDHPSLLPESTDNFLNKIPGLEKENGKKKKRKTRSQELSYPLSIKYNLNKWPTLSMKWIANVLIATYNSLLNTSDYAGNTKTKRFHVNADITIHS